MRVFLLSSLPQRAWHWREAGLLLGADFAISGQGDEPAMRSRETLLEPLAAGRWGERDKLLWPGLSFLPEVWMSKGKWAPTTKSSMYFSKSSLLRQRFSLVICRNISCLWHFYVEWYLVCLLSSQGTGALSELEDSLLSCTQPTSLLLPLF